jgi:hypothetical protein
LHPLEAFDPSRDSLPALTSTRAIVKIAVSMSTPLERR